MRIAQIKAKIISNKRFKENYRHLEFESGVIARNANPGQFVNIKVGGGLEPLLRRPISIHRITGDRVKLFYEVLGKGTRILSNKKPGEFLDIIGPLGNGFWFSSPVPRPPSPVVLVAGGMGVAPLVFLAEKLVSGSAGQRVSVLIGARTKEGILCEKEFKKLGCDVKISTDDGSIGFKGKVTELLKQFLLTNPRTREPANYVYACGPHPMLEAVALIAQENRLNAQLSREEHMACGIGACLGCVVPTKTGYKRACKDGPIFSSEELVW